MEMLVKIHSFIDVITNSSTEMFLVMNSFAVKGMFEVIDEILRVAKSDKKAEDIFDIEVERDWDKLTEGFMEYYHYSDYSKKRENDCYNETERVLIENAEAIKDWNKRNEYEQAIVTPYLKETGRWKEFTHDYDDIPRETFLKITAKNNDQSTIDIWNKITCLFEIVETSN